MANDKFDEFLPIGQTYFYTENEVHVHLSLPNMLRVRRKNDPEPEGTIARLTHDQMIDLAIALMKRAGQLERIKELAEGELRSAAINAEAARDKVDGIGSAVVKEY